LFNKNELGAALKPKVLVVDDHPMIIHAVEAMVHEIAPEVEILQSRTLLHAMGCCRDTTDICLILLDLSLPDSSHTDGLALLHKEVPNIPIVVYTGQEHASVRSACLRAGAVDFVTKSGNRDALYDVVERLLARFIHRPESVRNRIKVVLSARQNDVLRLLLEGGTTREIGEALTISEATVKTHIKVIYSRTQCRNRVELFQWHVAGQKALP
jgi:DNA-binding NarL/FixJ family response regulator